MKRSEMENVSQRKQEFLKKYGVDAGKIDPSFYHYRFLEDFNEEKPFSTHVVKQKRERKVQAGPVR